MRVRIRGKVWDLRYVPTLGKKTWGDCDEPDQPKKQIRVSREAKGVNELETLIHELFHCAYPDLREEAVEEGIADVARILWKLGWRKQ